MLHLAISSHHDGKCAPQFVAAPRNPWEELLTGCLELWNGLPAELVSASPAKLMRSVQILNISVFS